VFETALEDRHRRGELAECSVRAAEALGERRSLVIALFGGRQRLLEELDRRSGVACPELDVAETLEGLGALARVSGRVEHLVVERFRARSVVQAASQVGFYQRVGLAVGVDSGREEILGDAEAPA
jgi:hypothetical protein